MKNLAIYAQNSLGSGHLVMASRIAKEFKDWRVSIVDGGKPFHHDNNFNIIKLPEIRLSQDRTVLLDSNGDVIGEETFELRKHVIDKFVSDYFCDVFITDLFPFAWYKYANEIIYTIQKIKKNNKKARVVASVYDVLTVVHDKENYNQLMNFIIDVINEYYDLILYHADSSYITFEEQFKFCDHLDVDIVTTGYVSPKDINYQDKKTKKRILCFGGGGINYYYPVADVVAGVARELDPSITVDVITDYKPDIYKVLKEYDLVICTAGYNSVTEVIASRCKAVLIPVNFEQQLRAKYLEKFPFISVYNSTNNTDLKNMIIEMINRDVKTLPVNCNGVRNTYDIISRCVESYAK